MKIKKTTTRTYEIYDCVKWEMSVGETIIKREKVGMKNKGLDKCFCCGINFSSNYIPYLALVRNHKNVFICEECANEVLNS